MLVFYLAAIDNDESKNKFEYIYHKYYRFMLRTASSIIRDSSLAEDAVHETFVQLLKEIDSLRIDNEKSLQSYLYILTRERTIDFLRKWERRRGVLTDYENRSSSFDNFKEPEEIEQALALLEKFSPLLKKYAFFLQSEDALPDFQCFLLAFAKNLQLNELTISTDGAIISYINKAIYHHYIALSKAKRHQLPTVSIESQTDYDPLQFDTTFSESDTYNNLLLLDLKRALSTEEYHVIYDHYFRQYSIQEIATRDNKSRQAINKCKKTAIAKLRRYFGVIS